MSIFQSLVLGAIQGLTEFLPISSSGHLIFLPKIFGWTAAGPNFDVVLHLGTLLALIVYFRKKVWSIILAFFNYDKGAIEARAERKMGWLIILATVPAALAGLFLSNKIEALYAGSATIIGFNFIFWGIVLYGAEKFSNKYHNQQNVQNLNTLNWKKSLFIGVAQAIALIPGTSRSGITMTAGLFSKFGKKAAAEFSFLMSIPIIALAGADGLFKIIKQGGEAIGIMPLIIGFLASALIGYLAIDLLLKIIQKWSFTPFVLYRIALGVIILFSLL